MNLNSSNYRLHLYASTILVTGKRRSLLLDLTRRKYDLIPNSLAAIIQEEPYSTFKEIYAKYPDSSEFLDEYFTFLLENDHILMNHSSQEFPPLGTEARFNQSITNSVIDADKISIEDYKRVIHQLLELGCLAIQLRFFKSVTTNKLIEFLNVTSTTPLRCIDIIAKHNNNLENNIESIRLEFQRIRQFVLHSADKNAVLHFGKLGQQFLLKIKDEITSANHCGLIFEENFIINTDFYIESIQHNSCLNKKLSIDIEGNIKNCPSTSESFGNVKNVSLKDALAQKDFKKYWNINKDKIYVCKDCEFRYSCIDCRAFIEDPEDIYSKPLKCGYNPYTAEWEEWSIHPMKQKAIAHYKLA